MTKMNKFVDQKTTFAAFFICVSQIKLLAIDYNFITKGHIFLEILVQISY
jgi:hypothetical protein